MGIDSYGNPIPKNQKITIIALLRHSHRISDAGVIGNSGIKSHSDRWTGYLVRPLILPSAVKPGMEAEAEIVTGLQLSADGTSRPFVEKGVFRLSENPQNPFMIAAQIEELTEIIGVFTRRI